MSQSGRYWPKATQKGQFFEQWTAKDDGDDGNQPNSYVLYEYGSLPLRVLEARETLSALYDASDLLEIIDSITDHLYYLFAALIVPPEDPDRESLVDEFVW
jgi:hypothetical protein